MTKVGIVGYGNIGRAVERAIANEQELKLVAVFSNIPAHYESGDKKFVKTDDIEKYKDKIDLLFLCVGSATDAPKIAPKLLASFDTIDCYDYHTDMKRYVNELDSVGKKNKHLAISATGWDPGLFSMMRVLFKSLLPNNQVHTFWGRGVSQGHTNAIKSIAGVKQAVQYTVPKQEVVEAAKKGECNCKSEEKHTRECYVVCNKKDEKRIEKTIRQMPNYFVGYEVAVNFISEEAFEKYHAGKMNHGGLVVGNGTHDNGEKSGMSFSLDLASNPAFTSNVMVAVSRASIKLKKQGVCGALTMLDIPIIMLAKEDRDTLLDSLV